MHTIFTMACVFSKVEKDLYYSQGLIDFFLKPEDFSKSRVVRFCK